ncbi:innexin inx2-like [Procambarus clarkii]|uniref:innexin inx2-like n=1 Tax=Procambarus clarkii TaxID=6728 RepID=UPI0037443B89
MFTLFRSLRQLIHLDKISIDNVIFLLHYKVTMVLLVAFSVLVTQKQYFGDPIDCMVDWLDSHMIDQYCWIQSTYTIPALAAGVVGKEVSHPGVANPDASGRNRAWAGGEQYAIRHHKYYQWVVLFLFLQAGMFYVPRFIWKRLEGGRVSGLVAELNLPALSHDRRRERTKFVIEYFDHYFHHHNVYAYQFFLCELLNFVNVVGQMYFTDKFLGFGFAKYGPRVLSYIQDSMKGVDPMEEIFPKVAKCTFHNFGPSGTIMRHDALCVLPLNILNQKIFVFLWFWFVTVAVISTLGLVYRLATFTPTVRHMLLRSRSRLASSEKVKAISQRCYIGDWFLLYMIAKNMDPFTFKDFINDITPTIVDKEHSS